MEDRQLREELKALHDKIEDASRREPLDRDAFSNVMTGIVRVSRGEDLGRDEGEHLREQLEEQATEFEARHPRLAGALREVMDVLARLGI